MESWSRATMLVVFSQPARQWTGESACPAWEQNLGMLIYAQKIHRLRIASY
jgi:hypothetical protein